ncbi:MAG: class I SAM-dependent methyltransferase family protein [Methanosarcinaceae archaeon]|nr:class I SAM-dependent methyltransferase family protein [Methanosarcinaceae archaeon]
MRKPCIKVPKIKGEPTRCALIELELLDHSVKIASDALYIYLPLIRIPESLEFEQLPEGMEITEFEFKVQQKKSTLEEQLGFTPHYEVIGDIALIETDEIEAEKIAVALLKVHPHLTTVLAAITPVTGEYRIREFSVIAGKEKTDTIHREHGCKYAVDLAKAYFTPRLGTERFRVLSQIKAGDVVVDMFAGVGPYSILIAKKARPKKVIAIDKNPDAIQLLRKNIDLNSVDNVEVIEGDSNEEARRFEGIADHVIMNLPHSAYEFLNAAVMLTRNGGIIHYYGITPEDNLFDSSLGLIRDVASHANRVVDVVQMRIVRSYAPHQYNICIEVRVD